MLFQQHIFPIHSPVNQTLRKPAVLLRPPPSSSFVRQNLPRTAHARGDSVESKMTQPSRLLAAEVSAAGGRANF
jgi:hypothetical protein